MNHLTHAKPKRIAVIGAGVSSLSFIYQIKPTDFLSVDLYERSRVVGGRCATRTASGLLYDNGAKHFSSNNNRILNTILNELSTEDLITLDKWVYPFNKDNHINFNRNDEKIRNHNLAARYNYRKGIVQLGNLLFDNFKLKDFKMNLSHNVDKLNKTEEGWEVFTEKQNNCGLYDHVVFGTPAFNVAKVLNNSLFKSKEDESFFKGEVIEGLKQVPYSRKYSLVVAFEGKKEEIAKFDFYSLASADAEHPIYWLSHESSKEGRLTEDRKNNTVIFNVQMSDKFTDKYAHKNEKDDKITEVILEHVYKLLPSLKSQFKIILSDLKLWNLALPKRPIDKKLLGALRERNFHIIGDSVVGKGSVDESMLTGFELYDYMKAKF